MADGMNLSDSVGRSVSHHGFISDGHSRTGARKRPEAGSLQSGS
jgi:hypothetical protein